jgi:hypothetical protein
MPPCPALATFDTGVEMAAKSLSDSLKRVFGAIANQPWKALAAAYFLIAVPLVVAELVLAIVEAAELLR